MNNLIFKFEWQALSTNHSNSSKRKRNLLPKYSLFCRKSSNLSCLTFLTDTHCRIMTSRSFQQSFPRTQVTLLFLTQTLLSQYTVVCWETPYTLLKILKSNILSLLLLGSQVRKLPPRFKHSKQWLQTVKS